MGGGDTKSMNGNAKRKKSGDVSPVREEDTTETDTDSMSGSNRRLKKLSASNVTLTNVSFFFPQQRIEFFLRFC